MEPSRYSENYYFRFFAKDGKSIVIFLQMAVQEAQAEAQAEAQDVRYLQSSVFLMNYDHFEYIHLRFYFY